MIEYELFQSQAQYKESIKKQCLNDKPSCLLVASVISTI